MELTGLVQYIKHRHRGSVPRPGVILHPWQAEPPLPGRVAIDFSHHHPQSLPAPTGWVIIQRNGRVWLVEQHSRVTKKTTAQYNLPLAISGDQEAASAPTTQFLVDIRTSCRAKNVADLEYYVHWSRHLLANIRCRTGCELLLRASAVIYNPHYFASPHLLDEHRGAVTEWPMVPALLLIDSFALHLRCQVLEKAVTHRQGVWILKQHTGDPDEPVLAKLREIACLHAELPKRARCYTKWDAGRQLPGTLSRHVTSCNSGS
jgi:hypothetical protein